MACTAIVTMSRFTPLGNDKIFVDRARLTPVSLGREDMIDEHNSVEHVGGLDKSPLPRGLPSISVSNLFLKHPLLLRSVF